MLEKCGTNLRRAADVVDDNYFYWTSGGNELEAELLLDGSGHGWVGLGGGVGGGGLFGAVAQ